MSNSFESNNRQFPHLGIIPPEVSLVYNLNTDDVEPKYLFFLDCHFGGIQKDFPEEKYPELFKAVRNIRCKLKTAMCPLKVNSKLEVAKASEPNYIRNMNL